jgi:hypothetical protein
VGTFRAFKVGKHHDCNFGASGRLQRGRVHGGCGQRSCQQTYESKRPERLKHKWNFTKNAGAGNKNPFYRRLIRVTKEVKASLQQFMDKSAAQI